ncbi:MAG: FG-GAP-like repeat-containing protein [Candidatus Competibacterales bacterium]
MSDGRFSLGAHSAPLAAFLLCCTAFGAAPTADGDELAEELAQVVQRAGFLEPLNAIDEAPPLASSWVRLGRELFFSKTLSGGEDVACASCHHPLLGGGDGLALPVGESPHRADRVGPGRWHNWLASGDPKARGGPNVPRHSPTTFNAQLLQRSLLFDGRVFRLYGAAAEPLQRAIRTPDSNLWQPDPAAGETLLGAQARFPVISPQEMRGFHFARGRSNEEVRQALLKRLQEQPSDHRHSWLARFRQAAGNPNGSAAELITFANVQRALAAYQASQRFIDNRWYRYLRGDRQSLTAREQTGALLFFKRPAAGGAGCVVCHSPPFFSDEKFHNIAIPQVGRGIQPNGADFGRYEVTRKEEDRFGFRTPSLLNVAVTPPYGHTGVFADLPSVIHHHLDPERSIKQFDFEFTNHGQLRHVAHLYRNARANTEVALRDLLLKQQLGTSLLAKDVALTTEQIDALVAFLNALTDPCTTDPRCLAPWLPNDAEPPPDPNRLVAHFTTDQPPPFAPRREKHSPIPGERDPYQSTPTAAAALAPVEIAVASSSGTEGCSHGMPGANRGGFQFEELAARAGIAGKHQLSWPLYRIESAQRVLFSGGIAAGDLNGDCWPEIYLPTGDLHPDRLYGNNRDGTFRDISTAWGITEREFSNGAALVDLDGDQDLDLITSNILHPNRPSIMGLALGGDTQQYPTVYRNEEQSRFTLWRDSGFAATLTSWSFAFADYDADGDLDGFSTHWRGPGLGGGQPNHLWQNRGSGFLPVDGEANLLAMVGKSDFTFTGTFADYNLDGLPDLLITADFETSQVFRNLGDGRFLAVTAEHQIRDKNGMGAAVADYDNDGDLDWFVTGVWDPNGIAEGNWGVIGNRLYINRGGSL